MIKLTPGDRARRYNATYPDRVGLSSAPDGQIIAGCWMIGACYKNPNPLYGAYPHGYLERVHAMFPEARSVLHVFSGGLTYENALHELCTDGAAALGDCRRDPDDIFDLELVDMHGPEQGRYPTWQGDLHEMPEEWADRFDLILADPPYSAEDSIKYDCPAPNRGKIMRSLRRVCKRGGNLVWLDQVWPMHRKLDWKTWGTVGLVRSTNHRARVVSFFEAQ